jgi:hypothetical protein
VERDFFRIFGEQRAQFEMAAKGEFADVIYEKQQTFLGKMMSVMEQGIKEGLFKSSLQPAELAMIFFGLTNNIIIVFINSATPYELRKKGSLILEIFFDGTRR